MNYYTKECIDWGWHYKYDYPPLFKDLLRFIPKWPTNMISENTTKAVKPCVQLSYVLPIESLHLIPNGIGEKLLRDKSEYYSENYSMKWAFCKYIWESHVNLPHIDIDKLEEIILR